MNPQEQTSAETLTRLSTAIQTARERLAGVEAEIRMYEENRAQIMTDLKTDYGITSEEQLTQEIQRRKTVLAEKTREAEGIIRQLDALCPDGDDDDDD